MIQKKKLVELDFSGVLELKKKLETKPKMFLLMFAFPRNGSQ
jgi:hypothetical protein